MLLVTGIIAVAFGVVRDRGHPVGTLTETELVGISQGSEIGCTIEIAKCRGRLCDSAAGESVSRAIAGRSIRAL